MQMFQSINHSHQVENRFQRSPSDEAAVCRAAAAPPPSRRRVTCRRSPPAVKYSGATLTLCRRVTSCVLRRSYPQSAAAEEMKRRAAITVIYVRVDPASTSCSCTCTRAGRCPCAFFLPPLCERQQNPLYRCFQTAACVMQHFHHRSTTTCLHPANKLFQKREKSVLVTRFARCPLQQLGAKTPCCVKQPLAMSQRALMPSGGSVLWEPP